MRFEQFAPFAAFILLVGVSCKKDKDATPPTVRIILPVAGSTFAVPDTIAVRVQVEDDRQVTGLTVELLNAANSVVASGGTRSVDSPGGTFDFSIILADERLPADRYTLVARATDGPNDARGFLEVNILEAPLRLRSLFLAPPFSTNSTTISRIDSLGQLSTFTTVQDFNGLAVDSYWQHVFVAGSRYAPFQAIPMAASAIPWQVQSVWNDNPEQFTAVTVDPKDKHVYYATREGFIRGFTGQGTARFNAQTLPDHRCEAIVVMQNEVATWQRAIVGGASRIVTYTQAGTLFEQQPVQHERIALFHQQGTSLLHFANSNGDGLIEDLNITAGGSPDIRSFPGEAIRAVVRLDNNSYIVALGDRIVRFNRPAQTITQLATGIEANVLAYEAATGSLYLGVGNDLVAMDPGNGTIVSTMAIGSPVAHIHALLNR